MKFVPKLLLSVLFAATTAATSAATYTSMVVFGDSLSDPGNGAYLTGGNSFWQNMTPAPGHTLDAQGHFSNGLTAAEYLANALSGHSDSTTLGWAAPSGPNKFSVNYAVGGALSGTGHIYDVNPALAGTGVLSQIAKYTASSGPISASTLFYVQGGANDFFQAFNTYSALPANLQMPYLTSVMDTVSSNIASSIFQLGSKGAKTIIWSDLPDLGLTPYAATIEAGSPGHAPVPGFVNQAKQLSQSFNDMLYAKIGLQDQILDALTGGVNVISVSESAFLKNATDNPTSNMSVPCVFTGLYPSCAGLFFNDLVHPTTATHAAFAQQLIAAAVPEPEMWLLMMVGVGIVGLRTRRKA